MNSKGSWLNVGVKGAEQLACPNLGSYHVYSINNYSKPTRCVDSAALEQKTERDDASSLLIMLLPTPSITLIDFYSFRTNLYSNLHFHNEGKYVFEIIQDTFTLLNTIQGLLPNNKYEHFVFKFK